MPKPSPSHRTNRIAFINLEGQLETIAPDGQERRTLSQANRFFQFPAWSPNDHSIATIGGSRNGASVYAFRDEDNPDLDQNGSGQLLFNRRGQVPIYLNWAPNSNAISFIAITPPQQSFGLHVVAVDEAQAEEEAASDPAGTSASTRAHHMLATGRPCFWDWTPAGDQILVHLGFAGEQNSRLAFIDPFTSQSLRKSDDIAQPGLFQSPGISHSGNYWAFARMNGEDSQLVIDGRGFDERVTVEHHGLVALGWSPARDQLAYISPPGPAHTAYGPLTLIEPNGESSMITDEMVIAFFWSPDGRSIAYFTVASVYEQLRESVGLGRSIREVMEADGLGGLIREPKEADDRTLRLNLWVADVETHEQRLMLTFQPLDIYINQFLPFFDQYALSHRIWSPDSNAIVLPVLNGEQAKLMVIPVTSHYEPPQHIADGLMAFWSWQ